MLISIITGTYNSKEFIHNTIKCIKEQTLKDWECILVDDGSCDGTVEILEKICLEDARFRLICKKPEGSPGRSRNVGLKAAKGAYAAFCDHDDFWAPDKLEIQWQAFQKYKDAAIVHTMREICYDKTPKGPLPRFKAQEDSFELQPVKKALYGGCKITHSSVMAPLALIKKVGYFHEDVHAVDDYHLYLWLSRLGPIVRVKLPLTYYYFHDENLSMKDAVIFKGLAGMARILQEQKAPQKWVDIVKAQSLKSEGVYLLDRNPKKAVLALMSSLKTDFRLRSFAIWVYALLKLFIPPLRKTV